MRPAKAIANIIVAVIIPLTVVRIGVYLYARQADMHYAVPDTLIGQPLAAAETAVGSKFAARESGEGLAAFPSKNYPSGCGTGYRLFVFFNDAGTITATANKIFFECGGTAWFSKEIYTDHSGTDTRVEIWPLARAI